MTRRLYISSCALQMAKVMIEMREKADQPPVTLMWRRTLGRLVRRSITKS